VLRIYLNSVFSKTRTDAGAGRVSSVGDREAVQAQFDTRGSKCYARRARDHTGDVAHEFAVLVDGECGRDGTADVSGLGTARHKQREQIQRKRKALFGEMGSGS